VVPPLLEAYKPDYVVTQLGVDAFEADPLANLNLTTRAYGRAVKALKQMAEGRWIALGGGGYDVVNVARVWSLVWAIILGREDELPEMLPAKFCKKHRIRPEQSHLLDPDIKLRGRKYARACEQALESVAFVKKHLFPRLGAK
jgi:acetoin utilization protein AcuC